MPNFQIQGTLIQKNDTQQKSQSFSIREFVVEVPDGNYPQFLKFQLTQDRCEHLDAYKVGDGVEVHFDLRGKEYQGKYFTTLNAWKLVRKGEATTPVQAEDIQEKEVFESAASDQLPF